jgi:aminoglycoside 3-N-acetyltransferase
VLEVTQQQVIAAMQAVGVEAGDGLLIHSAVQYLGRPVEGMATYWDAIWEVLGTSGTLVVPTFNFDFARGLVFDPKNTPARGMGAFSEYVRQRPEALRTPHPMQSLAVAGHCATDLAARDTPSAFDPGSAFERMLGLDFKILLLGADIEAVSLIHYSEQRLQVPYRYWKDFTGFITCDDSNSGAPDSQHGTIAQRTYRMYVRDMNLDAHLTLHPVREVLRQRVQWRETQLNYGQLCLFQMTNFIQVLEELLTADPWSLVLNRAAALEIYTSNGTTVSP